MSPQKSEQQSGSDRLRPPYSTPLMNMEPVTAGASRDFEVGFNRLPGAYQRGLQSGTRPTAMAVGSMPSGYNLKGEVDFTGGTLIGDEAKTMAHELVHVLAKQMPYQPNPSRRITHEETLARYMTDTVDPRRPLSTHQRVGAENDNQIVQDAFPDPNAPTGLLAFLRKLIGL